MGRDGCAKILFFQDEPLIQPVLYIDGKAAPFRIIRFQVECDEFALGNPVDDFSCHLFCVSWLEQAQLQFGLLTHELLGPGRIEGDFHFGIRHGVQGFYLFLHFYRE